MYCDPDIHNNYRIQSLIAHVGYLPKHLILSHKVNLGKFQEIEIIHGIYFSTLTVYLALVITTKQ